MWLSLPSLQSVSVDEIAAGADDDGEVGGDDVVGDSMESSHGTGIHSAAICRIRSMLNCDDDVNSPGRRSALMAWRSATADTGPQGEGRTSPSPSLSMAAAFG